MKCTERMSKKRFSFLFSFAAASVLAAALAGCGSSSSGDAPVAVAPPAAGGGGGAVVTPGAPAAAPVPTGAAPVTLTAATPAATFAALAPVIAVGGVSINSPPCVTFSMADASNNPIIGFGSKSQSATATAASYPNLAFSLAKLVPGTNGAPSKWVSYIVTTVPTKNATTGAITASVPTRPTTDNTGTLTDNKNGTYTYCFYRDVKKIKDEVAAATLTAPSVAADLGDLTYEPTALHRLVFSISGNAPGTGSNTADGVTVTTAVPMSNPMNVVYDFIPATGKAVAATDATVAQRLVVDKASCNECHSKLGGIPGTESAGFHGGSRYDPRFCTVCHTDQRKFGQARVTSTANAFAVDSKGAPLSTYVADGVTIGDFPVLIHRVHKGEELVKKNYNYGGVLLNETRFPTDIRNCTKCHDTTAPKVAPQGDNWKMVPSRVACGACHDGIDWATGKGTTNAGGTGGHIGGAKADDSLCALCHDKTTIPVYHTPVTPPNAVNIFAVGGTNNNTNAAWIASNTASLPDGAIKVTYDISSVSVNASKNPVMVFKMLQNGTAVPFNTYSATGKTEIWDNFMGSPSVYFVWAVAQDGITAPADFNVSASGYIRSLWNGIYASTATAASKGTLTGPDASGYYTATLTGAFVDSAVMLTGGVGYTYGLQTTMPLTQTNLAGYPTAAAAAAGITTVGMPNKTGGLIVIAPDVQKVATGYTGRRAIVEDARCNKCHIELGAFTAEAFHAGQRNDGTTCSWCHTANRASQGWSVDSTSFIHAIHAAGKRGKPFTYDATAGSGSTATNGFFKVGYPGILSNCEQCHAAGTYDFSASASASALPNRLYRTVATGTFASTSTTKYQFSPYVTQDLAYGSGFSYNVNTKATTAAAATTLVNSPIATACFSCHDSDLAKTHMTQNGGAIYEARTTALAKVETCTLCHLAGKTADIKAVHNK